jgi:hypothetical protein
MEDALISTAGLAILTGADVIDSGKQDIIVHTMETIQLDSTNFDSNKITLKKAPYTDNDNKTNNDIYVMVLDDNGEVATEPYLFTVDSDKTIKIKETSYLHDASIGVGDVVLVDYYTKAAKATQIEITPDKFGGNFYLEASTLFRDTNGVDMPAEFIIPNCKIQSNFTFTMASSGDPSTFTFTMDAFPDYTRFNKTKKVLAAIQIVDTGNAEAVATRTRTSHDPDHEKYFI